jgi:hypothetical protein
MRRIALKLLKIPAGPGFFYKSNENIEQGTRNVEYRGRGVK